MNTLWKQALIAAALGTAVTAGAHTRALRESPGATPDPSPMTKPATGAGHVVAAGSHARKS